VRLRIALVLGTSTGGIGMHVHDLAAGFVERGHQVTVAGPGQTEEHFGFTRVGAYFRPVPISASANPGRDLSAVRALRAAVADTEVVHAHGVRAGALTGLALARRDTPRVVTLHNAMLAGGIRSTLLTGLEKLAVLRADVVLGASADLVERARALGARDARLGPVPAPPLPAPSRDRAQLRAELGVDDGVGGNGGPAQILVLAIGRLAPQKDYATLLQAASLWQRAWAMTKPGQAPPRLVIAGDGPLRAALQGEIDSLGLDAALLGHREDMADLLAAADLLALCSTWEARALAVQEAMRAGLPVVATRVGGIPELTRDAALLVPPGDAGELARAVVELATEPALRAQLAERGRVRASRWPDTEQCLFQLGELYAGLVDGTARKR
jgi:glycosyltransferase involved in cell wall biosynthesis